MDEPDAKKRLLSMGADLVGAAVGGAIGFITKDPLAAAGAAALGTVCSQALDEMASRVLSSRESMRVGAAGSLALNQIREGLDQGRRIRTDGFFSGQYGFSNAGYELFEGLLLKAKQQHEERKLPYLAHLYANVVFDETCSAGEANYLLNVADVLTYTQFCLLGLFGTGSTHTLRSTQIEDRGQKLDPWQADLLRQAYDLCRQYLLLTKVDENESDDVYVMQPTGIVPRHCYLSRDGRRLFELLNLGQMPEAEFRSIGSTL